MTVPAKPLSSLGPVFDRFEATVIATNTDKNQRNAIIGEMLSILEYHTQSEAEKKDAASLLQITLMDIGFNDAPFNLVHLKKLAQSVFQATKATVDELLGSGEKLPSGPLPEACVGAFPIGGFDANFKPFIQPKADVLIMPAEADILKQPFGQDFKTTSVLTDKPPTAKVTDTLVVGELAQKLNSIHKAYGDVFTKFISQISDKEARREAKEILLKHISIHLLYIFFNDSLFNGLQKGC